MQSYILCLIIVCLAACGPTTTEETLIVDQRVAFNDAIAEHDISTMGDYCAYDIMVVTSRNSKFIGKDQYVAGLEQEFKTKENVSYVRTPTSIDVYPSWEMAAETGQWVGKWKNGTEAIEVEGTYYAKWKKTNGRWMITAEVYTPLKCTGGNYCMELPK